jgi:predicted component of type VI protein secretion system
MIAKLIVASGKNAGRTISIKRNKLLIGRAEECDVRPLSEEVSRRHCAVHVGPVDVFVEDLGSRNGTYVNGVRITGKTKVAGGDMIRVGALELKVSCTEPAARGSEDEVSRWLLADEAPAGMFDTTHSLQTAADSRESESGSIHAGVDAVDSAAGSAVSGASSVSGISSIAGTSGIGGAGGSSVSGNGASAVASTIDAIKEARGKPAGLPAKAAAKGTDSSRDAAAEALKKFFGNR